MRKSMYGKMAMVCLALFSLPLLSGCGGSSGTGAASTSGVVKVDVTDAAASNFAHVYVTVTAVAFHTSSTAGFSDYSTGKAAGWQVQKLSTPTTIDLAQLANGTMYADVNGNSSLFNGITLPTGKYQQMRIFLASTEDAYQGSISGLTYNNEVQLNGDSTEYPLRVPTPEEGIRLVPETPVVVTAGGNASITLDFNLNNDIVEVHPNGSQEYMLKPRLGYYDMASVGAIKGTVSFGNLSTSGIVVKAERVKNGANYRVVHRQTTIDKSTGSFKLYPLPIFGNATTAVYDLVVRGRNVQTAIIKGVTVHKGTTTATGVDVGTVPLQVGTEFTAQLSSGMHPSGAWINFYQTISGDSVPYEVRYRHLNPYTGMFTKPVELSAEPVLVATYAPGQLLSFASDSTSQGTFSVVADASGYYDRGASVTVSGTAGQAVSINMTSSHPKVGGGARAGSISDIFDMALIGSGMGHGMGRGSRGLSNPTSGQVFVTHGGMVIDSLGVLTGDATVSNAMHSGGGMGNAVKISNLPSGVPGAVYGMYAVGWGNGVLEAGTTRGIDMTSGDATAIIKMK